MNWTGIVSKANSYAGKANSYAGKAKDYAKQVNSYGNLAKSVGSSVGRLMANPGRAIAEGISGKWAILSQSGWKAVEFTSMLEVQISNDGQAVSTPIEKGSFATYNKVQSPREISVTLGLDGNAYDIDAALQTLRELQTEAELVNVSTPTGFYEGYTIESSTVKVNASALVEVDLTLVEVREVETQQTTTDYTPAKCKNATSASTVNRGKAATKDAKDVPGAPQAKEPYRSGAKKVVGAIRGK